MRGRGDEMAACYYSSALAGTSFHPHQVVIIPRHATYAEQTLTFDTPSSVALTSGHAPRITATGLVLGLSLAHSSIHTSTCPEQPRNEIFVYPRRGRSWSYRKVTTSRTPCMCDSLTRPIMRGTGDPLPNSNHLTRSHDQVIRQTPG